METRFLIVTIWLLSVDTCELIQLSCETIKALVDGHNNRRQLLLKGQVSGQPMAEFMKYMVWDEELATKAKNWAYKYEFKHNPNRHVSSGRFTIGENIYWFSTMNRYYEFVYDKALAAWWDEHKHFTYQTLSKTAFGKTKKIGHYTQMAWADSDHLGCGLFEKLEGDWLNFFLVCDYGPAGNFIGDKPYMEGASKGVMICVNPKCEQPYGEECNNTLDNSIDDTAPRHLMYDFSY